MDEENDKKKQDWGAELLDFVEFVDDCTATQCKRDGYVAIG